MGLAKLTSELDLGEKINRAYEILQDCSLCPRQCRVDRLNDEIGFCGIGREVIISSAGPHYGEEACLVGHYGSGTVFFCGCNLRCVFCQNYEISHSLMGYPIEVDDLSKVMLSLQRRGCHNINLVTPTHCTPQIIKALVQARDKGLRIPIVYNCGGYELVETLYLLEGFIDIYMPDTKYGFSSSAQRFSQAPDYFSILGKALKEMQRQVDDLVIQNGIAQRGLLIRHLVMPGQLADSKRIIDFVVQEVSPNTYINIMDQYHPCGTAEDYPEINRRVNPQDFAEVYEYTRSKGLRLAD